MLKKIFSYRIFSLFFKFIANFILINPLSVLVNLLLYICVVTGILFFSPQIRSYLSDDILLPFLERLNVPKIDYKHLKLDNNNTILATDIKIYDDNKEQFLEVDKITLKPLDLLDINKGLDALSINEITFSQKPFFQKTSKVKSNNSFKIPVIPFDIKKIDIKRLVLKPKFTNYKRDIVLEITGKVDKSQGILVNVQAKNFDNASLLFKAKKNDTIITFNHTAIIPADIINAFAKQPILHGIVTNTAQGKIDLTHYSQDISKPIMIDLDNILLSDKKRKLTGSLKTNFYAKDMYFKSTDLKLYSGTNKLVFKGEVSNHRINGHLIAKNFNIIDFYSISDDFKKFSLNGDVTINGDFTHIPHINGSMNIDLDYQNNPFLVALSGEHQSNKTQINLLLNHYNKKIIKGFIALNNQKNGSIGLKVNSNNLPLNIKKKLPVSLNQANLNTKFKIIKNELFFSQGKINADEINVKRDYSPVLTELKNVKLEFSNALKNLKIKNATMKAYLNKRAFDVQFNADMMDYYKPKSLRYMMVDSKNPKSIINADMIAQNNKEYIDIKIQNFKPNFLMPSNTAFTLQQISGTFKGDVNLLSKNAIRTLNGTLLLNLMPQDQISLALNAKVKKGDINGQYQIFMDNKSAGQGTIKTTGDFNKVSLKSRINLRAVTGFIQDTEHRLQGDLNADIVMTNNIISGNIDIKQAGYKNLLYGTVLKDINLKANIYPDNIHIIHFAAKDSLKGLINAEGIISLSKLKQSTLELKTHNFTPLKDDIISVKVNSLIKLTGYGNAQNVTGDIELNDLLILLPDIATQTTPSLNIVRSDDDVLQSTPKSISILEKIQTNINVSIVEGAKIIGFGLQGFPYGKLAIKGTLDKPYIDGQIDVARGTIEILGKTFKISEGGISLKKTNPVLNIKAIKMVDDIEIALMLKGTINNPSVLFSSLPAIANDEIISLLVFGKNKDELSPFQALRLANAFYQLSRGKSGAGGKLDVIGNTERFLDIDHLSINSGADNSVSIGAGKYINDKIYIGTDYNPVTTDSAFLLDLKLSDTLLLKTRLSNSTQGTNSSEIMLQKRQDY